MSGMSNLGMKQEPLTEPILASSFKSARGGAFEYGEEAIFLRDCRVKEDNGCFTLFGALDLLFGLSFNFCQTAVQCRNCEVTGIQRQKILYSMHAEGEVMAM